MSKAEQSSALTGVSQDPNHYKYTPPEHFTLNKDLEDIYTAWENVVKPEDYAVLRSFVLDCVAEKVETPRDLQKAFIKLRRRQRKMYKKSHVGMVLRSMEEKEEIERDLPLKRLLIKKAQKSTSGVLVITVLTSPYPKFGGKTQRFSCEWNCYYCPNEPDQPRSYLHDEPSVLRANRNGFDAVLQFYDRAMTLSMNGHPVDKIELLILGGTWASYPHEYQEEFIRDLFYAANTFFCPPPKRERFSLDIEKSKNETARCKIIGITLETRPDCINSEEIKRFRRYGCTRVQIGVQHTDNGVLEKINRGCTTEDTKKALKLLKDSCYKIDIHLMPNLPGSNPEKDAEMFRQVLYDPDLQADQWKIYPCEVTPWTVIQKWFESGEYVPYGEEKLSEVLIDAKTKVHPWIRLNRVVRDIPSQYIIGGVNKPSMRQDVLKQMQSMGLHCRCIRCREVKGKKDLVQEAELKVRKYEASGGLEYFISFETPDEKTIFGFARLRIVKQADNPKENNTDIEERVPRSKEKSTSGRRVRSKSPHASKRRLRKTKQKTGKHFSDNVEYDVPFPELRGAALVRELHVYGQLVPTQNDGARASSQHVGFGKRLMFKAEELASQHKEVNKIAVISGVGVRNFYRKIGYELTGEGEMMMKDLKRQQPLTQAVNFLVVFVSVLVAFFLYKGTQ
mmetsp:Transcript_2602/g.2960  ORF Transcript_2602/g.2960 Transcript_2602/m.2960 type:complete len:676 (+) Transcript_2602:94-2121(+)